MNFLLQHTFFIQVKQKGINEIKKIRLFKIDQCNAKIKESQNDLDWKQPSRSSSSNSRKVIWIETVISSFMETQVKWLRFSKICEGLT